MKKLFLILVGLVALVGVERVEAQSTCFLPSACGTTTFTGGTLTGPLFLPDGDATNPALSFSLDTDAGFYRAASNNLGLTLGGALKFQFNGTPILTAYGSAASFSLNGDVNLNRDAANTLALRNGTNAQAFNIYNTYTDASNYERATLTFNGTYQAFQLTTSAAGTGTQRALYLSSNGTIYTVTLRPDTPDFWLLGVAAAQYKEAFLSRSIQGSKSKVLTEGAETAVTQIAVPQTAGVNYADAEVRWTVYASDGTDSQTRRGTTYLAAVNKAGTETCTVGDVGTPIVAVSAGTLTCTSSCIVGLTDVVQFGLNCTSSLTQTTLTAEVRLDMMKTNTVTPQ